MKNVTLIILSLALAFTRLHAQVPNGLNYQAAISDNAGTPLENTAVTLRFTIHRSTLTGPVVYQETHATTTTDHGLVDRVIGQGTVNSGTFAAIEWESYTHFLQTEVNTGGGFVNLGTQQLMSVPYALTSKTSTTSLWSTDMVLDDLTDVDGENLEDGAVLRWNIATDHWEPSLQSPSGWGLSGNTGSNENTNFIGTTDNKQFSVRTNNTERMRFTTNGFVGIGTNSPQRTLHVHSTSTTSNIAFSNSTTGATSTDGLNIGNLGNLAYILNGENADLQFGTNNTVRATIKADGKFSIGTTSADELVHFEGGSWQLHLENNSDASFWNLGASGTGWAIGAGKFAINNGTSSTSSKLVIDGATGNVGIGDSTPDSKLDVQGSITSADLAGTGVRHVYADGNGVLHTVALEDNKYYYSIPGYDFHPGQPVGSDLDPTMDYLISEEGFEFWDDDGEAVAGIHLPDGALITGITVYFEDNFVDNDIWVQAAGISVLNGNQVYLGEWGTAGSSGYMSDSYNPYQVVNNALYTYAIWAGVDPFDPAPGYDDLKLRMVTVEYELHP